MTTPAASSFSAKAFSGLTWVSTSQLVRQATNFLTSIVLARLLTPEDFGLVSMASVAVGFAGLFRDLGTSSALIQKKEINEDFLSSLSWISSGIGLLLMLLLILASPWIADFFGEPLLAHLVQVLAFNLFISCLLAVPLTLMVRALEFDRTAKIDMVATVAGAVLGIAAACRGAGAWSLVFQSLGATLVTAGIVVRSGQGWPKMRFNWQEVRPVMAYSLNLTGFNIFNFCVRNLDNLVIGKFLGAKDLGYYTLAYRLLLLPLQLVSDVAGRVMFPVFARMQDDLPLLRESYQRMLGKIALFTFPMMLGLWAVGDQFVPTIYGEQWMPVATLLVFLAPVGMVQSIGTTVGIIYQVRGRTDLMLYWSMGVGLLLVPTFWVGVRYGLTGVTVAYALVSLALALPNFIIPCRLIGMRLRAVVSSVTPVLWPALAMATVVSLFARFMQPGRPSWANLLILVSVGGLAYVSLLHLLKVGSYRESRDMICSALTSGPFWRRQGRPCGE
jgi:PST family polysaccharide transporter